MVGTAYAVGAAILFAVNGTVSKAVLTNGLGSLRLVEIRCLAAAVLFALIAAGRPERSLRLARREIGFVLALGVTGIAMVQWLYFVAIARMPVSISLLIEFTAPLMVALWVRFVRGGAVRGRVWAALVLCLAGLALVAEVWSGLTLDAIGLVAAVLAAVSLAAYLLLAEHGLGTRDPFSLATCAFGVAAGFWALALPWWTFPFHTLTATAPVVGRDVPIWVLLVWIVVAGTVAPFALMLAGIRRIGATRAGLIGTAEPVLAGIVAWIALSEVLSPVQILGSGVVLAGIMLAETSRAARRQAPVAVQDEIVG